MTPRLHLIVARARNGVIGRAGGMPWHLPEDLAHFRRLTMGHALVMGRRTWDAIGRPLPGRRSLVLTRDTAWSAPGAERVASLDEAVARCSAPAPGSGARTLFVIGGAQIYALALARGAEAIELTAIDAEIEGDTVFPALEPGAWRETRREHFPAGAGRALGFDFVRLERAVPPS